MAVKSDDDENGREEGHVDVLHWDRRFAEGDGLRPSQRLMREARDAISTDRFDPFCRDKMRGWGCMGQAGSDQRRCQ